LDVAQTNNETSSLAVDAEVFATTLESLLGSIETTTEQQKAESTETSASELQTAVAATNQTIESEQIFGMDKADGTVKPAADLEHRHFFAGANSSENDCGHSHGPLNQSDYGILQTNSIDIQSP
jgi:hypothetical protein